MDVAEPFKITWLILNSLGVLINLFNLAITNIDRVELIKRGKNGKEETLLWQRAKDDISMFFVHSAMLLASIVDRANPYFITFVIFSITCLAYASFSRRQLYNTHKALIKEVTGGHKFPKLLKENKLTKEQSELVVVGVWTHVTGMAPLDIEEDFSRVLKSSGSWRLAPISGFVSSQTLKQYLTDEKSSIDIFYFAGHSGSGGLYFNDGQMSPHWCAKLLKTNKVKLAILSSCKGRNVARSIWRFNIPVVFMDKSIEDRKAILASEALIDGLSAGYTLKESVQNAQIYIEDYLISHFGDDNFRLREVN